MKSVIKKGLIVASCIGVGCIALKLKNDYDKKKFGLSEEDGSLADLDDFYDKDIEDEWSDNITESDVYDE